MCRRKHKVSIFLDLTGILMTAAFIAVTVAFATPYWYSAALDTTTSQVTPFRLPFHSLGLWMLCYREFPLIPQDVYWTYKYSCRYFLTTLKDDISLPGFFIATQVLYTIGVALCAIGFIIHFLALGLFYAVNRALVAVLCCIFLLSALFLSVALIVFAGRINDIGTSARYREWIFGWPGQDFNWSFWLGVAGTALLWIALLGYLVEVCRMRARPRENLVDKKTQIVTTVYYPSGEDFIPYTAV